MKAFQNTVDDFKVTKMNLDLNNQQRYQFNVIFCQCNLKRQQGKYKYKEGLTKISLNKRTCKVHTNPELHYVRSYPVSAKTWFVLKAV